MGLRPLSAALLKKSSKELNEDSRRTASDINAFREWLEKQSHLASVHPSDQWLVAFLRGCKFSLERSKEKIDLYYTLRTLVPEFFFNRDPMDTKIQAILSLGVFLPLQSCKDDHSPRINIIRVGMVDPSRFHLNDLIKVSIMVTEILMLEDDHLTVAGEIHVHNKKYNNMYKAIPKCILPAEYGGSDGTLQDLIVHWKKKVESYRDWFIQQETERSDETKRGDQGAKTSSLLFGVEGSFRKLDFD